MKETSYNTAKWHVFHDVCFDMLNLLINFFSIMASKDMPSHTELMYSEYSIVRLRLTYIMWIFQQGCDQFTLACTLECVRKTPVSVKCKSNGPNQIKLVILLALYKF